jgi:hypothetical protein
MPELSAINPASLPCPRPSRQELNATVASWISGPMPFSTAKMMISRTTPVRCLVRKDQERLPRMVAMWWP